MNQETKDHIERDAVISDCGLYRYLLRRSWDHAKPRYLWVMLNPSTADASVDDATIRSCTRLCRKWGGGSFEVVNLFGFRATDPADLAKAADPIGPRNDAVAEAAIHRCDIAICGWGAHPMAKRRERAMADLIRRHRPLAYAVGVTKAGAPKHPLYIKSGTPLQAWSPA